MFKEFYWRFYWFLHWKEHEVIQKRLREISR